MNGGKQSRYKRWEHHQRNMNWSQAAHSTCLGNDAHAGLNTFQTVKASRQQQGKAREKRARRADGSPKQSDLRARNNPYRATVHQQFTSAEWQSEDDDCTTASESACKINSDIAISSASNELLQSGKKRAPSAILTARRSEELLKSKFLKLWI